MKYSIWAAVSTETQAGADKVSLAVQLEKCNAVGSAKGWTHYKDYIVPGESRSNYISLYHAEKDIPTLHALMTDAQAGKFNLLVVYDLNRFRSLMRQVFDALSDYGVQFYILSDPRDPVPPSDYTDEIKSAVGMIVDLRGIISNSEINNLRRHYRDKMPKRVTERRLHPGLGLPPYGYRKPPGHELDRSAVLIQVPDQVRILRRIKAEFLAGSSLTAIAAGLNADGIPSPRGKRWWYSIIAYLLANPFYAGVVQFGSTKRIHNRRDGTVARQKSAPVSAVGKHQPIWDKSTLGNVQRELAARGQAHPGILTRQLSRLLYCPCGAVLWAQTTQDGGQYWRCSSLKRGHAYINNVEALHLVTNAIIHAIENIDDLKLPAPEDARPALLAEIKDLESRKKRLLDAYETGEFDLSQLKDRISKLEARLISARGLLARNEQVLAQNAATHKTLTALAKAIHKLPSYYQEAPPAQVNAELRAILKRIIVGKDHTVVLEWR